MRNPGAFTDEVLDRIEEVLGSYDLALQNILYKHFNPIADQKEIADLKQIIAFARNGESDEELLRSFEEHYG